MGIYLFSCLLNRRGICCAKFHISTIKTDVTSCNRFIRWEYRIQYRRLRFLCSSLAACLTFLFCRAVTLVLQLSSILGLAERTLSWNSHLTLFVKLLGNENMLNFFFAEKMHVENWNLKLLEFLLHRKKKPIDRETTYGENFIFLRTRYTCEVSRGKLPTSMRYFGNEKI